MSNYGDYARVTTPQHCNSRTEHGAHSWHESGFGLHHCTGNHLPTRPAPSGEAAEPTTTDRGE